MKKLYLLILRTFFGPFFLIFFIVLFVLLIQFLWRYIDELVGKGLDTQTIGELLLYTSASLVPMALPLSILMSSLMTFGNLGERYELTAIKASGISLQKILRPLVILVFFISIGAFFFANDVLPYANLQMRSLLYDIRQQRPELQIKPGEFNNLIDGYSIRVGSKDPRTSVLYDVTIYDHTGGKGNTSIVLADSGTMTITENDKYFIIKLFNGHSYNELFDSKKPRKKRSYPHRFDTFDEQQIVIELTGFGLQRTDQSLFKSHYSMLNLTQLTASQDSLGQEIEQKQEQMYKTLVHSNYFKKRRQGAAAKKTKSSKPTENQDPKKIKSIAAQSELEKVSKDTTQKTPTVKDSALSQVPTELADEVKQVNIDSIYNLLTITEQTRITNSAVSYARTAKNLIENSKQSLNLRLSTFEDLKIEWHRKFTISFACLLFMFIGAPLGAIIRKGGLGLPLVISVVFFILYYILFSGGRKACARKHHGRLTRECG